MLEAAIFLVGVAIVAVVSAWFGIVILAPRIGRLLDRAETDDEEPGDRPA